MTQVNIFACVVRVKRSFLCESTPPRFTKKTRHYPLVTCILVNSLFHFNITAYSVIDNLYLLFTCLRSSYLSRITLNCVVDLWLLTMNIHVTAHAFRSPTAFERSKQQLPLPEHAQPELEIPAINGAVSVPTPHPPSPPLSGDESDIMKTLPIKDEETVPSPPTLYTPPSTVFPLIVPVSPAVEIPAPTQAPSVLVDDLSDKGKQKDPYVEALSPKEAGLESPACETELEERLNEWELVDKDEAAVVIANDTTPLIGADHEIELGDKGITIPDSQESDVPPPPAVAHSIEEVESEILAPVVHVDAAIQASESPALDAQIPLLEPRRLEEEEAPAHIATERTDVVAEPADLSITLQTNIEVIPTESMPLVDETIEGEPKTDTHADVDSVEETVIEQLKREEDIEHQVQEAKAPVLEEVPLTESIIEEPAIDSPVAPVDLGIAIDTIDRDITAPEAVGETTLEEPKADIPITHVAPEQDVQDLAPYVEPEVATELLAEPTSIEPEVATELSTEPTSIEPEVVTELSTKPISIEPDVVTELLTEPTSIEPEVVTELLTEPTSIEPEEATELLTEPIPIEPEEATELLIEPTPIKPEEATELLIEPAPIKPEEATEFLAEPAPIEPGKLELEGLIVTETQEALVVEVEPSEAAQGSDDDFNRVPSVSPRIPTPQLAEKSLDWDTLVDEICKEHNSDLKEEIAAVPVPENAVEVPGPSTLPEEPAPVLFTPQVPPISYDTPPVEVQYIPPPPPPPIPPRRIEDEERQPEEKTPDNIIDVSEPAQSTVPDVIVASSPPELASLLTAEVKPRMHSRTPSLISRPSLADIREEVGNEDAESPVAALPRQEPVLTEVVHPVDLAKPVAPEVTSVRKMEDEMNQSEKLENKGKSIASNSDSEDGVWVRKHKETDIIPSQDSVPLSQPESPGPVSSTETPHEVDEKPRTDAPSVKEKTGLRKLARTFSFGGSKSPISEMRPGTSHSTAVSIASVDHDRRSVAESTASTRNKFMKPRKLFGLGKDKDKKEQVERPSTATSVRSVTTSPATETPPSPKLERRNTRDLMKLAIGRAKKKEAEGSPSSPVDSSKKMSMSNAVNLMMMKKKAQEEKVRQAEAQQAAATSAPPSPEAPEVKESMSPPQTPSAAEASTEASPPPTPKRRNTLNSAVNLMMRRRATEEKESDIPTSVTPIDGSAIVSDDQATPAPIETQAEATAPKMKRRGSLSMNKAVDLMMLRKKVKEDKEEDDKVNASAVDSTGGNAAIDSDVPAEVSPPPTPSRRVTMNKAMDLMMLRKGKDKQKEEGDKVDSSAVDSTGGNVAVDTDVPAEVSPPPTPSKRITMNKAMDLMMLRKGKDKEKEKEGDDSSSSRDADSTATPKKDKRITVGGIFGRKKSSQNSPTIGSSNTRPATPSSSADHGVALASPLPDSENPIVAQTATVEASKHSRAPSIYSVDQRPGTSSSMKKFGAMFKKRTPSIYSKEVPDSPNPFNAPGSPFPTANGIDRSPVTSETDEDPKKSKLSRRWSVALGAKTKPPGRLSSSGEPSAIRPPTSSSIHVNPVSPPAGSKIPVATVPVTTSGTVPETPPAASPARPKLAAKAKTFMAFNRKKN